MQHFLFSPLLEGGWLSPEDPLVEAWKFIPPSLVHPSVNVESKYEKNEVENIKTDLNNENSCSHNMNPSLFIAPLSTSKPNIPNQTRQERIVKTVKGPSGNIIPIYGPIHNVDDHAHVHIQSSEGGEGEDGQKPLEGVYALGQAFPTCCSMRIPSVIGARMAKEENRRIPFD